MIARCDREACPAGIAFLVKRFPRLSETFVLNELLELRRQGVAVRLFALMDPVESHVQPEADQLRPEVTYLRGSSRRWSVIVGSALRHPLGTARVLRFALGRRSAATWRHVGEALVLAGELDRQDLGHVHAHFAHSPAAVAHLAHLLTGVSYSFTAHAKDLYTTKPSYIKARSEAASFVVTCTEANRRYLVEVVGADPSKVIVCRHGIDLERFLLIRRVPAEGRILSVGRLVPKKGFDVLVRACAELAQMGARFECVICGDGPLRGELEALVRSLGLSRHVHLTQARPQPDLLREYERAEVFALAPTVMENGDRDGLPNVILEAMAAGVPVVATSTSAIPELLSDGSTGRLVPPQDPVALAHALSSLLSDPQERRRLGETGRAHVAAHFGLEDCVSPLADLFSARRPAPAREVLPA
jgi:glycosyltransferase involved in cell wall biosynthesis